MANIASLLKTEIVRLARKEVRKEVQALRKASATHRREIAALKRSNASLERRAKQLAKRAPAVNRAEQDQPESKNRFSAKGLRSMRTRLGLSADQLAKLLGVSMQSVYNWERKVAVPRAGQIAAIAGLRSIGKKEALQRLEALAAPKARKPRARKSK
jgi:DNA-binding transcriptional regulator YiaG